jgi:hypothetical protein
MNMPKTTIAIGTLLVIQGIGFYIGTDSKSVTALIPAFVGLPILLMELLAFKESARMHAMHVAAALGVLGLLAAIGRIATAGLSLSAAGISLMIMVLLTGSFVLVCVKSFVDARRRQH